MPVIIRETRGRLRWLVEFVDEESGEPKGIQQEATSQQLRKAKKTDDHPTLRRVDSSSKSSLGVDDIREEQDEANGSSTQVRLDESEDAIETYLTEPDEESSQASSGAGSFNPAGTPARTRRTQRRAVRVLGALFASPFRNQENKDSPSNSSNYEVNDTSFVAVPDKFERQSSGSLSGSSLEASSASDAPAVNSQIQDNEDKDLAMDEDVRFYSNDDNVEDEVDTNILAMGQDVEHNDDKYKRKWDGYLIEKTALLNEGYRVKCKPPTQKGIDIGANVAERRGEKRKGIVVADDRDHDNKQSKPVWSVQFDSETMPQRFVPSTQLQVIKDKRVFEWKIVEDSFPTNPVVPYQTHGIVGFDFSKFDDAKLSIDNESYDFPYLRLLIHLWPGKSIILFELFDSEQKKENSIIPFAAAGDWRQQLRNFNLELESWNTTQPKKKRIGLVSENEWWIVWGIIFSACPTHKAGKKLFEKATVRQIVPSVNFGKDGLNVISHHRFQSIKEKIHLAFYDRSVPDDPYHPVRALLDGFNDNRRRTVATSIKQILDESMSPYQPRTTKTSILPNLSFIFRKPKPLGIEKKVSRLILTFVQYFILNWLLICLVRIRLVPRQSC
jgi:hypothetical protein